MIEAKTIIDIVAHEAAIDPATLTEQTNLKELGVTSLDMMNVLFSIEEASGVFVELDELTDVETLGDFIRVLQSKAAETPDGPKP